MRRIMLVGFVMVLIVGLAPAAFATVHPIQSSECAAPPADGTAADTQTPPGVSDDTKRNFLQPLIATGLLDQDGNFVGPVPALHGDSGDGDANEPLPDRCQFPETTDHGDAGPGEPDENEGRDRPFPGNNP